MSTPDTEKKPRQCKVGHCDGMCYCIENNTPDTWGKKEMSDFWKKVIDKVEAKEAPPDTEIEELVKLNRTCGCTLGWCAECLKWKSVVELAASSRDTYWKERVRGERERYKKYLQHHYEQYGIESVNELIINQDNLK